MLASKNTVLTAFALGTLAAQGVFAQEAVPAVQELEVIEATQTYRQLDQVAITGSSIVRKEQTTSLPVQVITREDIRRNGLKSTAELIQALPVMSNFVESSQQFMVAGGYAGAAIHGLPSGTLVLVNGLRMAPFGRSTITGPERAGVDLQSLPLADIERIEVLTEGASSLYGTDAVAGVVNIILRRERKGLELRVDRTQPVGSRASGWQTGLSWGHGQLRRDGYSLLVSAELSERQELLGADRPYAAQGRYTFSHGGQPYRVDSMWLDWARSPATFEQRDGQGGSIWANSADRDGRCAAGAVPAGSPAGCLNNNDRQLGIYPYEQNRRLHMRAERELTPDLVAYTDLLIGHNLSRLSSLPWWPVASGWGLTPGSAAHAQAVQLGLDPLNTRLVWQPDLPGLQTHNEQTNGRWSMGVQGVSGPWNHSSTVYMARSQATLSFDNPLPVAYDSVGLGAGGVWNDARVLQPLSASPDLQAAVASLRQTVRESRGSNTLSGLRVRGSRALAEMNGMDVMLGVGAEWREEHTAYTNELGRLTGGGTPDFQARRRVLAAHSELLLPLRSDWELNLGLRADRYSDVGHTTNAKVSTRWQPHAHWTFRASAGTGFRAPGVAQMHRVTDDFVWATLGNWTCTPELQQVAQSLQTRSGQTGLCVPGSPLLVMGNGNPDLKPERSTNLSWGLAFAPSRNLRLSADLWSVDIHDVLLTPGASAILGAPLANTGRFALLPENFAALNGLDPRSLALRVPMENLGQTRKAGIDLEGQWRHPSDWGTWSLQARATRMLRSRTQLAPGATYGSDLGEYDPALNLVTPLWRAQISAGLSRPGWSAHMVVRHTSGYKDAPIQATNLDTGLTETIQRRVSAFTTMDLVLLAQPRSKLEWRAAVRNVFNTPAPLSFVSSSLQLSGANAVYSQLWGRVIELGVSLRF